VQGINLISLVWRQGEARLPCDFRLYNKAQDGLSKNDHFQQMVAQAYKRCFEPELVAFDSWYSSLPNLKLLRDYEWHWLTQLKRNLQVSVDHIGLAIRAFVRLEAQRLRRNISYFASQTAIIRDAIRAYLAHPTLVLESTA
jgi:putative transposase